MRKLIEIEKEMSREEVYRALLDGRVFATASGALIFYDTKDGRTPFRICIGDAEDAYIYKRHQITHEEIEVEWYENIPDCGTLCWAWDHPEDFKILALIFQYNSDAKIFKVRNKADSYTYFPHASPATLSEIDKFLIAEQ